MKKVTYIWLVIGIVAVAILFTLAFISRPVSVCDLLGEESYGILAISSDLDLYKGEYSDNEKAELLSCLEKYQVRRAWLANRTYSIPFGKKMYNIYIGSKRGDGTYVEVYLCEGERPRFDLHLGTKESVRIYEALSGEENTTEQLLNALKEIIE
jgi:hypothetical protein